MLKVVRILVTGGLAMTLLALGSIIPAAAQDKVVLHLIWEHQFQFAGFYAADWQGYYRDAGIEVEIRTAVTPERKIIQGLPEVAEGRADFTMGGANILVRRDKGDDLVVVATLFQRSPVAFYALRDRPFVTRRSFRSSGRAKSRRHWRR